MFKPLEDTQYVENRKFIYTYRFVYINMWLFQQIISHKY